MFFCPVIPGTHIVIPCEESIEFVGLKRQSAVESLESIVKNSERKRSGEMVQQEDRAS